MKKLVLGSILLGLLTHGTIVFAATNNLVKECNNNKPDKCIQLARSYYSGGNGFEKNVPKAVKIFDKAKSLYSKYGLECLKNNSSMGCYYLGLNYKLGHTIKKSAINAEKYLIKSYNLKASMEAARELGNLYGYKIKDYSKSIKWYKLALSKLSGKNKSSTKLSLSLEIDIAKNKLETEKLMQKYK